jgi:hypothetical protein
VSVPKEKEERLLELLPGSHFVSTYSPPKIRKKIWKTGVKRTLTPVFLWG